MTNLDYQLSREQLSELNRLVTKTKKDYGPALRYLNDQIRDSTSVDPATKRWISALTEAVESSDSQPRGAFLYNSVNYLYGGDEGRTNEYLNNVARQQLSDFINRGGIPDPATVFHGIEPIQFSETAWENLSGRERVLANMAVRPGAAFFWDVAYGPQGETIGALLQSDPQAMAMAAQVTTTSLVKMRHDGADDMDRAAVLEAIPSRRREPSPHGRRLTSY